MTDRGPAMEVIAKKIGAAIDSSDFALFKELLDPDVAWGPADNPKSGCKNRDQVLAWWNRSQASGTEAHVSDTEVVGSSVIVELVVRGTENAAERGGTALRWQVDTVREGRVIEIVGFDDHAEAVDYAEAKSESNRA